MESQPQNPEFRINPKNFPPCAIRTLFLCSDIYNPQLKRNVPLIMCYSNLPDLVFWLKPSILRVHAQEIYFFLINNEGSYQSCLGGSGSFLSENLFIVVLADLGLDSSYHKVHFLV